MVNLIIMIAAVHFNTHTCKFNEVDVCEKEKFYIEYGECSGHGP